MELTGVSIIIPTFNRAGKVVDAVDSVLSQAYPEDSREVIVVDDGSSDGTREVLRRRYGSRIRLLQQPNGGPSAARNRGVDAARHEVVAFLDSDDRWLPTKLERQGPSMNIPGVVLSYSNWIEPGRPLPSDRFRRIGLQVSEAAEVLDRPLSRLLRRGGSGIWTSTCLVRKDALRRCGGYDERMRVCEDIRLWFRLALEGKFSVISEPLVERGEPGTDNLMQPANPTFRRESARLRLELFWETYAHATNESLENLKRLREFIVTSLYEQSVCYAVDGDYSSARRKAFEALAFSPSMLKLARILGIACLPSLVRRRRHSKADVRASEHAA